MYQVVKINAFRDNYIWALVNGHQCAIIDPGEAAPVLEFIKQNKLVITDILVTHHHPDHIGGISEITQDNPAIKVFGPHTERFPMVTHPCRDNDKIELALGTQFTVLGLTGHTLDHIGYVDSRNAFVGDTLFSAGCGRLFEGTPEQMQQSLLKIAALPEYTQVYCAHEYTEANLAFAKAVEQQNQQRDEYAQRVSELRQQSLASIPTNIALEKAINPFLRADQQQIQRRVQQEFNLRQQPDPVQTFVKLREWKDNF